jgi:murein hydrolase activator
LDTLRQEYAKSMVYAYKNRGNYEFLNFIFSADNFNDAVKRIAYLKSYRTFREMQGQNILRTQELRVKRLQDLGVTKITKSKTLEVQKAEVKQLEDQKTQQDRIVENLKKQGKDINARIAEKERQVAKVNGAIKKAIAKALKDAKDKRIAEEKEAKRLRDIAVKEAAKEAAKEAERKRKEEALIAAANARKAAGDIAKGNKPSGPTTAPSTTVKTPVVTPPVRVIPKPAEPVVISSPSSILNASFERNRGSLPWPVDNPSILIHFGKYTLNSGQTVGVNPGVTISCSVGAGVKSVFDGRIVAVEEIDNDRFVIVIEHGKYFTSYNNINGIAVKVNQEVKTGQLLGKVATNIDGIGSIDFTLAKENSDLNPETWLRR